MTVRAYCDAAYALLLREYQRRGLGLTDSLEHLSQWSAEHAAPTEEQRAAGRAATDNARSLRRLEAMMGGTRG